MLYVNSNVPFLQRFFIFCVVMGMVHTLVVWLLDLLYSVHVQNFRPPAETNSAAFADKTLGDRLMIEQNYAAC